MSSTREIIHQAIIGRCDVDMRYRNNSGMERFWIVTPLKWTGNSVFLARCYGSDKELTFNINNVLECGIRDQQDGAVPEMKKAAVALIEVTSIPTGPIATKDKPPSAKTQAEPFDHVHDGDQWSRLVRYYRECLIVENRQQYIIGQDRLQTIDVAPVEARWFMSGTRAIQFDLSDLGQSHPLKRFLRFGLDDDRKQLCVGYPLLALTGGKVAPLIYCQAAIEQRDQTVTLRPEAPEISYAALKDLGFSEEEIGEFLNECNRLIADSSSSQLQALEDAMVAKIGELLQIDLRWSETFEPLALLTAPGLFWVEASHATAALIEELDALAQPSRWQNSPDVLKHLLSSVPEHDYPQALPFHDDPATYVTPVNHSQAQAATAANSELLTVITGPPGTGKSQLVLNLIANAYLNGQSVLFASYNNPAVDVVMSRLQQEIKFQGAVRTGNMSVRAKVAQQIESNLNQIATSGATSPVAQTRQLYQQARQAAIQARDELQRIRELKGLLESRRAERKSRLESLSLTAESVSRLAQDTIPTYRAKEIATLQSRLEIMQDDLVPLRTRFHELSDRANGLICRNDLNDPAMTLLRGFSGQWGDFGEGMLEEKTFDDVFTLRDHLQRWLNLLPALEHLTARHEAYAHLQQQEEVLHARTEAVPIALRNAIPTIAESHSSNEAELVLQQLETLNVQLRQIIENRFSLWERFLILLRVEKPMDRIVAHYDEITRNLQLDSTLVAQDGAEAASLRSRCRDLTLLVDASQSYRARAESQVVVDFTNAQFDEAKRVLPDSVQSEFDLMPTMHKPTRALLDALTALQHEVDQLQVQVDMVARQLNDLLDGNQSASKILVEFKATRAGASGRLWSIRIPARLVAVDGQIRKWKHLLAFWVEDAAVKHIEKQLGRLPDEPRALGNVQISTDQLLKLGGQILQDTWFDRAKQASNPQVQRARDYARSPRSDKFSSILNLFPIWATTNLSTKPNFPLQVGLFDLVIIDEASQCDIPSALPLLYRAKRAVIIGDPNQLRHIATITEVADLAAAQQDGISRGAFLYSERSLFDLGQRSVGNRPGTLFLNEHFRSDSRIISFSNREFYNNTLVIKTDLTQKGLRRGFLNDYGGVYWLHVSGRTVPLPGGSAVNDQELSVLKAALPRLIKNIESAHGMAPASLGIVTPYRAHKEQISEWLKQSQLADLVRVGTAHMYQGDERDFIVFSPVLADGISAGSLNWLKRMKNLLNVALTRARVALIIIGDWDFCHTLPIDNPYRRLADYVIETDNRLYRKVSDAPLLGGPVVELPGIVIDPHNPEHSRATLNRFFTSCREHVWWLDNYFTDKVIELFRDVFDHPRTIIGPENRTTC